MRKTLLATLIAVTVFGAGSPKPVVPDAIHRLDRCIQARFLDARAFGMSRIAPRLYHGVRDFQPENPAELSAVTELRQQGYQVVFYLAGQGIAALAPIPGSPYRSGMQGPVWITSAPKSESPRAESLLEESRRALASFAHGEGYGFERDGWTVVMRPVRASRQACIHCHLATSAAKAGLHMGDAMGVAVYLYRR